MGAAQPVVLLLLDPPVSPVSEPLASVSVSVSLAVLVPSVSGLPVPLVGSVSGEINPEVALELHAPREASTSEPSR